jgi:hypothetical protein
LLNFTHSKKKWKIKEPQLSHQIEKNKKFDRAEVVLSEYNLAFVRP